MGSNPTPERSSHGLERLNSLTSDEAYQEFLKCCGSSSWAEAMTRERPFSTLDSLKVKSDQAWWSLSPEDWLEAFRSHPRIGEKKAANTTHQTAQKWSEQEQSRVSTGVNDTREALADLNRQYEQKFGYIFIVCASGKSAEEIVSVLRERIENDDKKELRTAATEQAKITALRLEKLLNQ